MTNLHSNFQLGQMLHKEYETIYATAPSIANSVSVSNPVRLASTLGSLVAAVMFVAQVWGF